MTATLRKKRRSLSIGTVLLGVLLLAACTSGGEPDNGGSRSDAGRPPIVIGSFDFSESQVLAEVYGSSLERHGYPVRRLPNVATREIMEPALEGSIIDFVPEYLGTALTFLRLGESTGPGGPKTLHRSLRRVFADRGIAVLDFAPAGNKNEVVVTQTTATEYGLEKISDLSSAAAELTFGGPPECPARPLCLAGLQDRYGLDFKSFQPLDAGGNLTVSALENGEIDIGLLFTTNPQIDIKRFVVLDDDLRLQPPENIVPVVRQEIVDVYGETFVELIDSVTAHLSTETLRFLNQQVDVLGEAPSVVASNWLELEGLVP